MRPFGWKKWRNQHNAFTKSGWRSLERWGLAYLHSDDTLHQLARVVARNFRRLHISAGISVDSIWIDGTPQVKGFATCGAALKSELADLLLIVNETNLAGVSVRRSGLLLQGKTSERYNLLPSNRSTNKERRLLESLDRHRSLEVYRDMKATPSSRIGTYTFGGSARGLKDCARYLIMPKGSAFCGGCSTVAPFQVGWPSSLRASRLRSLHSLAEAIQRAALHHTVGRQIFDKSHLVNCEWSNLVWDLVGDYALVMMNGYGGQARMNSSPRVLSLCTSGNEQWSLSTPPPPVPPARRQDVVSISRSPAINILQINVRMFRDDPAQEQPRPPTDTRYRKVRHPYSLF